MRTSDQKLNPSLSNQIVKTLAQLIVDVKDLKEGEIILRDFFNETELEIYSKRLAVAYYLKKGRSYSNIKENLKVSSATIASIEKLLDSPGFKLALKKVEAEEWANVWSERIKRLANH